MCTYTDLCVWKIFNMYNNGRKKDGSCLMYSLYDFGYFQRNGKVVYWQEKLILMYVAMYVCSFVFVSCSFAKNAQSMYITYFYLPSQLVGRKVNN